MNVLCVIESGTWIEQHIVNSLTRMAIDVVPFFYGAGVGEYYGKNSLREKIDKNNRLLNLTVRLLKEDRLDLIFCYVYDDFLLEETAKSLYGLNVPMVNYNVDMVNQWYRQTRTAKYFTRILCAQRDNMKALARYNPRVMFWPMAGIAPAGKDKESYLPNAPVTFVGTPTHYRKEIISRLHQDGIPLAVYGKYWLDNQVASSPRRLDKTLSDLRYYAWPKFRAGGIEEILGVLRRRMKPAANGTEISVPPEILGGFVVEKAMTSLFANSQINLGFTRMSEGPVDKPGKTQVKLRDFEVPLAGGFYLVERVPEYEEHFRPGVEIETWATYEELLDKINYYLKHPEKCRKIAAAGKVRAEREHTWNSRFIKLFSDLNIA